MSSRSKRIGTGFESAVVRFLSESGVPCRRVALTGAGDEGDVRTDDHRLVLECKGGKKAEGVSDALIREWLVEAERERVNAGVPFGALVRKVAGKGEAQAGLWMVHMSGEQFSVLTGALLPGSVVVGLSLGDFVEVFRHSDA